jgi:hypothetical protein
VLRCAPASSGEWGLGSGEFSPLPIRCKGGFIQNFYQPQTHCLNPPLPIPYSLFPIPYSLLPTPYSLLPTPYSLVIENRNRTATSSVTVNNLVNQAIFLRFLWRHKKVAFGIFSNPLNWLTSMFS